MSRIIPWRTLTIVAVFQWVVLPCKAENWPQFRGLNGSGIAASGSSPPVNFDRKTNVVWKTAVPAGHSSPCVWEDRIFLTAFSEKKQLLTLCIDRASGNLLWKSVAPSEHIEKMNPLNSPASSTPVTDGERVYAYFGSYGLVCYDFDGTEVWRRALPPLMTNEGAGASPILIGDAVVVNGDSTGALSRDASRRPITGKTQGNAYTIAVHRSTGETLWKKDRPLLFGAGAATPIQWHTGGVHELILVGAGQISALHLADGSERWRVDGIPSTTVATPVIWNRTLYVAAMGVSGNYRTLPPPEFTDFLTEHDKNNDGRIGLDEIPEDALVTTRDSGFREVTLRAFMQRQDKDKDEAFDRQEWMTAQKEFKRIATRMRSGANRRLLAIRLGGTGNVSDTHIIWEENRGVPEVPSPACNDDRLFLVKNGGIVFCRRATTGELLFQKRLGATGGYYASPIIAGGKVYFASERGVVTVIDAADQFNVVARNDLSEQIMATPAVVDDNIYVRTDKHLFAFGQ